MKFAGLTAVCAVLVVAACSPRQTPGDAAASSAAMSSETAAISMGASEAVSQTEAGTFDAPSYIGAWTGVKGTTLTIVPDGAGYTLTIANGGVSHDYPATVADHTLTFIRDGNSLSLTKGDGAATGEDALKDKHDCIIVTAGEGYCK